MKSCISLYSFWRNVHDKKMTQFEVIDKIKSLGIDAVELLVFDHAVPEGETMHSYIKKLHAHATEIGLDVPIISMDSKMYCDDPEATLSYLCSIVDVASELSIPIMRFDIAYKLMGDERNKTYKTVIDAVVPYIRRLADYAKEKGVRVCSENHGRIIQDSYRVEELIRSVNHEWYGLLCDIGNFGSVDEDCAVAVSRLLPYIYFVHAKDAFWKNGMSYDPGRGFSRTRGGNFRRATIFGHGDVPTYQILTAIKNSGYDGYVSLEFEGMEDVISGVEISAENLKRMLADIEKA